MHSVRTAERHGAVALPAIEDEDVARRSAASLLITASTQGQVETLARRIHGAGARARFPFVHVCASDLPAEREALRESWGGFLDAAAGGSLLISGVEKMRPAVQNALGELVAALGVARTSAAVRLIAGTTVSLHDRVAAGTFSERLFYRLNFIHLTVGTAN